MAATFLRDPDHPAAGWLGDLIVHTPSAAAREQDRQLPFPAEHGAHLPGLHHFDLLNHPAVSEQLKRWIGGPGTNRAADRPRGELLRTGESA
ncbi:MAG: hypothetical protein R2731_02315 [Nocardioides sp.]